MGDFVHLHLHSEYSLLDGACRIKQLIQRVKDIGQTAVAITDHGCMYGAVEFYNEATANGIKPIIGCEVYVARRTRHDKVHNFDAKPYHLVLLCENNEGYQNLIKLVSLGYTEGFYNKPRVDIELLKMYSDGLICLSACLAGEIAVKINNSEYNEAVETVKLYQQIFGKDNYFIEIQNHGIEEQIKILPILYKLSNQTGAPLVATNDAHYLTKDDAEMQRVLLAIQTNSSLLEKTKMGFDSDEFYVKTYDEMARLFKTVPQALENTIKIAERCNVTFEFGVTKLPKFEIDGITDNAEYFRNMCYKGMHEKYGQNTAQEIKERMDYELNVIIQMGYVDYYLIVWDFIKFAKDNDIPVGPGRGSGAGSICAYCIGITGIDPIKFNLLFERFLNPERVSMPDFDIDFCIEGRQRVIDYVVKRYGSDRVAQIVTFGTLAAKAAIRDVGRAMDLPYQLCDKTAKLIPNELNITIEKALKKNKTLSEIYATDSDVHKLIDMAKKVEGMPRHTSVHAAGVVISSAPVSNFVPLLTNDGAIVTQYTMTVLESLGLLKMDFLGLRNLTVIRDCENLIHEKEPNFDISKIQTDDKEVYKMLSKGDTLGVFQFESSGMKQVLSRLMPENIEDLIAVIALYRPGPMESIPKYIKSRHNPSEVTYPHPLLKDTLEVTYGCIVYQEQVMQICRTLAGYSYGRADLVRRAMAKKKHDVMIKERQYFLYGETADDGTIICKGAVRNGIDEKTASDIFDSMLNFASYAFNKSHAAAYAYLSYQTAYLKCHYFKEYMASLMTSVLSNTSKLIEYIEECRSHSVAVLRPDINKSYERFTTADDGIYFGLLAIKGMGKGVTDAIISEREENGYFISLSDFCERMTGKDVNRRAVESLIMAGVFDEMGLNRRQMLSNYDAMMTSFAEQSRQHLEGQMDLFGGTEEKEKLSVKVQDMQEYSHRDLLKMEKETIGIYISGSPLGQYDYAVKYMHIPDIKSIIDGKYKDGDKDVHLLCSIASIKEHTTKNKAQMCFMVLEDKSGTIEAIVFPATYEKFKCKLYEGAVLYLNTRISYKDEQISVIVENIFDEDELNLILNKKRVCIKVDKNDEDKIKSIVNLSEAYTKGDNLLCFYLVNDRKYFSPRDKVFIKADEEFFKMLCEYTNSENIGLTG